jgi:hypothetical protein
LQVKLASLPVTVLPLYVAVLQPAEWRRRVDGEPAPQDLANSGGGGAPEKIAQVGFWLAEAESLDGKRLLLSRGEVSSDVVLLSKIAFWARALGACRNNAAHKIAKP